MYRSGDVAHNSHGRLPVSGVLYCMKTTSARITKPSLGLYSCCFDCVMSIFNKENDDDDDDDEFMACDVCLSMLKLTLAYHSFNMSTELNCDD